MIKDIILCSFTGAVVGGIFAALKLPVPVPHYFPAVMGIVGMWVGSGIVIRFING